MFRWIVSEDKLDSNVLKGAFWGDRIKGNAEKFPDCAVTTGEALVAYKHPHELYSAAAPITSIPTFHRCGPGFPRFSFSPSLSLFLCVSYPPVCNFAAAVCFISKVMW